MSATVSIILKLIDQASGGMGQATKSWTELNSALSIGKAAFSEISQIARQAYQVINEGAQIQLAETRFNRLAESIGTTGDALMKDLGPAVGGMLSQAGQMKLAGDLMSLGLAKTTDEAVRLTGVASQLGMDMNQLVLTLTNQTTMRFDALGVAVDGFDAKVKALEAQGYSTDEAFKWAFIQQAEGQIEKVGSVSDTTAGQLKILEAAVRDFGDEAKKAAAEGSSGLIEKMSEEILLRRQLIELNKVGAITDEQQMQIESDMFQQKIDYADALKLVAEYQEKYNEITRRGYDIQYRYANSIGYVTNASQDNIHVFEQSAGVVDFYAQRAEEAARANNVYATSIANAGSASGEADSSIGNLSMSYSSLSTNVGSATEALQNQIEFIAAGGGVVSALIAAAQQAIDSGDLELAQKITDQATIAATDVQLELNQIDATEAAQQISDQLGIGFDEAEAMVDELQQSIFALTSGTYLLQFGIQVNGSLPPGAGLPTSGTGSGLGKGGSGDDPYSYASGTNGWQTVPGAAGAPFPVTLHGGESFNVVPNGKSGGGDSPIFIDTIIVQDGSDFAAVLGSMIQNQNRNALSMRGGAGYAGT